MKPSRTLLAALSLLICSTIICPIQGPCLIQPNTNAFTLPRVFACQTKTFSQISPQRWRCFTDAVSLQEQYAFPAADSGRVSGKGATIDYVYKRDTNGVEITVVDTPWLVSCNRMNERIREFIADCYGPVVKLVRRDQSSELWRIEGPDVKKRETNYPQIKFRRGDRVRIDAGGCVQTGGRGNTWRLYVDPSGPESDRFFHGLITLPGMSTALRLRQFVSQGNNYQIPSNVPDGLSLTLGYEDVPSDYANNGYWGHDDGIGNQCRNIGKAWLELTIYHAN